MQGRLVALAALLSRAVTVHCTVCGGEGSEERGKTTGHLATALGCHLTSEPVKVHSWSSSLPQLASSFPPNCKYIEKKPSLHLQVHQSYQPVLSLFSMCISCGINRRD